MVCSRFLGRCRVEFRGLRCLPLGWVVGLMCLFLFVLGLGGANAQTWDEWWNQKKTQLKYLNDQIAALQVYGGYVKQGYALSRDGLASVSGWAKGELGLHSAYYGSLRSVNPVVSSDAGVKDALAYGQGISGLFAGLNGLPGLDDAYRKYIASVAVRVLGDADAAIDELGLMLTPGKVEMTDEERLKRVWAVKTRLADLYEFTASFCYSVKMLVLGKGRENDQILTLRRLYGIDGY
jgi:hypothetical protein